MIKKITAFAVAIILLLTCFSACSKDDGKNKAFACAVNELPVHFDPQIAKTQSEKTVAVNIFDGLFKLSENGEAVKCAVSDYSVSADGLSYTFTIKDNLKYYISSKAKKYIEEKGASLDGRITAEDFAFGIIRGVLPETSSPDYELLSVIKNAEAVHKGETGAENLGVRVIDDLTLEITLEHPSDDFIYALTQPVSYPCDKEFFELTAGRYGLAAEYTVSNGAFYLSSVNEGKSVSLAKNTEYIGDFSPLPASVSLYLNSNETDIAKKVDKGTYDIGFFSGESALKELGRSVQKTEMQNIACSLIFNMSDSVMQNASLRTGLISAVELSAVTKTPLKTVVPPYYKPSGNDTSVEGIAFNGDEAQKNMIEAYKELGVENLTVEVLCTEEYEAAAKAVVSCWQKNIGVELNGAVKAVSNEDFIKLIKSGEYDTAIYPVTVDSQNAVDFLSLFAESGNAFGYESEEYSRIFNELKISPSGEKISYCQSFLLKNGVVLPLFCESTVFAVAKNARGIYFCGDTANVYFYKGLKK